MSHTALQSQSGHTWQRFQLNLTVKWWLRVFVLLTEFKGHIYTTKTVLLEIHNISFGFDYWSDSRTSFSPHSGKFFQYWCCYHVCCEFWLITVVEKYLKGTTTQVCTSGHVGLCDWLQPQQVWIIGSCCGTRVWLQSRFVRSADTRLPSLQFASCRRINSSATLKMRCVCIRHNKAITSNHVFVVTVSVIVSMRADVSQHQDHVSLNPPSLWCSEMLLPEMRSLSPLHHLACLLSLLLIWR